MGKSLLRLALATSLFHISTFAHDPPLSNPAMGGVVERELEKDFKEDPLASRKEVPAVQIDIPEEQLLLPEGKSVLITSIELKGNEALSTREILNWVKPSLNRRLSLQEIYEICQQIEQCYAAKGYFLARAYPPPQEIEEGSLLIEVLEGKLGKVEVVGAHHYSADFVASYFHRLLNKALRYEDFLKALLLLNDNRDLAAGAVLKKGAAFGTADVEIRVKDEKPLHLNYSANNYGKELITTSRAGAELNWGNVVAYGDTFKITEIVGFPVNALYFTQASYDIPLNRQGTILEAGYLYSKYQIQEFKEFDLNGYSKIATLKVNQAVQRTRLQSIDFFSSFEYKQIENLTYDIQESFDKLRVLTLGATVNRTSPSGSFDYVSAYVSIGIPNILGGLKVDAPDCSRPGGGGRFYVLNVDYDHVQPLIYDSFLAFHASGQWSPNKLTVPEQIYIGGDTTVRGFPLAVAAGDSGYYLNLEVRLPPPFIGDRACFGSKKLWKEVLQLDVFLDQGGTILHEGSKTALCGAGVGARINGPYHLMLTVDVGVPLNHRHEYQGAFAYAKLTGKAF